MFKTVCRYAHVELKELAQLEEFDPEKPPYPLVKDITSALKRSIGTAWVDGGGLTGLRRYSEARATLPEALLLSKRGPNNKRSVANNVVSEVGLGVFAVTQQLRQVLGYACKWAR